METRYIKAGDKVRIYMNADSYLSSITNEGTWTVNWTPHDVGDVWTFERNDQVISISSCSANFDGLELVESRKATP